MKHFKLTNNTKIVCGRKLFQIEATIDFQYAKKGELGGWVEREDNLSGNAWVSGNTEVYGNAKVSGNAWVSGNAEVYGDAKVYGNAWVYGDAEVYGNAEIMWFSKVGSCNGTLTAFLNKNRKIMVTRGCFIGTLEEFRKKIERSNKKTRDEYKILADFIELRFKNILSQEDEL